MRSFLESVLVDAKSRGELAADTVVVPIDDMLHAMLWGFGFRRLLRPRSTTTSGRDLTAHHGDEAMLELLMLAGTYRTVSYLVNGLRLPLEPGACRFPGVGATPAKTRSPDTPRSVGPRS